MTNFYEELGVKMTATKEEIKKTYRKSVLQCHPDKNPGNKEAEEKFKKISEAYENLIDDTKRAKHDSELQQEQIRQEQLQQQEKARQEAERKAKAKRESRVKWGQIAAVFGIVVVAVAVIASLSSGSGNNSLGT